MAACVKEETISVKNWDPSYYYSPWIHLRPRVLCVQCTICTLQFSEYRPQTSATTGRTCVL